MERTCPQCNQRLPEVEALKFRFCPHCGAGIDAGPRPLDESFLTVPPDLPLPPADTEPENPAPADKHATPDAGQFDDQTIPPLPTAPRNRPQIRPPAEPPPPGFLRTPPSEPETPPPIAEEKRAEKRHPPLAQSLRKPAAANHQKLIVAVLIILALIILILGGIFTF